MILRNGIPVLAALAFLSGCAARQRPIPNWRLVAGEGGQMLIPPLPPKGQAVVLRNARSVKTRGKACEVSVREIQLGWRGRTARLTLNPETFGPVGDVSVASGAGRFAGIPVLDLGWWSGFGRQLEESQNNGCLAAGDAARILMRIVDNVPMSSHLAFQLRHGNFIRTGYMDLRPEFALRSVAPLLKPGVARYRGTDDIDGYETVYYDLKRRGENGIRIELARVEHNRMGVVTSARRPLTEVVALPASMRYARYYFRMWSVGQDRKIALLAAASRDLLDPASKKFEADPEGFCKSPASPRVMCLSVPAQMMIAPELRVSVNGRTMYLPTGGNLGQLLRDAGVKDPKALKELLPRLQVLRPYEGLLLPVEFDRSRGDIFSLAPIGGEQIRW
jgi:hypothetical protein